MTHTNVSQIKRVQGLFVPRVALGLSVTRGIRVNSILIIPGQALIRGLVGRVIQGTTMTAEIGICLATHNGAAFLSEQLQSIAGQTFPNWHLYIRDDASSDDTLVQLSDFAARHPERVTLIKDGDGRLGPSGNFRRLMGRVREPYVAFSDQDDVWRPQKLERTYACMRALEEGRGAHRPCMVHADRSLIDAEGREIAPSYWGSRALAPSSFTGLETYLTFCLAAGSTMLINRRMLEIAQPVPTAARMYDCWIELLAHGLGEVAVLEDVVLAHRRHGGNATGATQEGDSAKQRRIWRRALRLLSSLDIQRRVYGIYFDQASALRHRHAKALPEDLVQRLDLFLSIPDRWLPGRILALRASGAAPPGLARMVVFAALSGRKRSHLPDKIGTPAAHS